MAALPYMQLFVADYLADTMHLNAEEHGAYLLLLMNYWQTGKPLADNDVRLQCVCRADAEQWQRIRPTLQEFFEIKDGYWVHHRVEADLEKVKNKSKAARKAAEKRHGTTNKKRPHSGRNANAQRTQCHTDTDTDTDTEHTRSYEGDAPSAKPLDADDPPAYPPDDPIVESIPLNDHTEHPVTESQVAEYRRLYPAVDVPQALRSMRGWCQANPTKRKTRRGVAAFITSWLSREQDRGGSPPHGGPHGTNNPGHHGPSANRSATRWLELAQGSG